MFLSSKEGTTDVHWGLNAIKQIHIEFIMQQGR